MTFQWNENKDRVNRAKHKLSFETAVRAFRDPWAVFEYNGNIGDEDRFHVIGSVDGMAVVLVVFTVRLQGNEEESYRIVSARKASVGERKRYQQAAQ